MTLDLKYENEQILHFMYNNHACFAPVRGCHLECDFASKAVDITYHFKERELNTKGLNVVDRGSKILYFANVFLSKEELIKSL